MWVKALANSQSRKQLNSVFQLMTLMVCSAFRITSDEAELVVANISSGEMIQRPFIPADHVSYPLVENQIIQGSLSQQERDTDTFQRSLHVTTISVVSTDGSNHKEVTTKLRA